MATEAEIRADERAMVEALPGITDAIQAAGHWLYIARAHRDRADWRELGELTLELRADLIAKLQALGPVSGSIGEG